MHFSQPLPNPFVQRPSVTALFPYGALCIAGLMWFACTLVWPASAGSEPVRLIAPPVYFGICAINAAYAVALAWDAWFARQSAPEMRRAHWTGIAMGLLFVAIVQFGAEVLWGPVGPF